MSKDTISSARKKAIRDHLEEIWNIQWHDEPYSDSFIESMTSEENDYFCNLIIQKMKLVEEGKIPVPNEALAG